MPLSVIDLCRDVLPKTNCGDCGYRSCMAFAGMVVSEKLPLKNCPHLEAAVVAECQKELDEQYAAGKWLKRDMAADALAWAKERSASVAIPDLPERIGGKLVEVNGETLLELPFFNETIRIGASTIYKQDGSEAGRYEQVFIFNHMAQGGSEAPTGNWKSFKEFPNTVSKQVSMKDHVEAPLIRRFSGDAQTLRARALALGGDDRTSKENNADLAVFFQVLPRVPVILMYWDGEPEEGFEAEVKLLFDETVTKHLGIESIMFLSERLSELLCETD